MKKVSHIPYAAALMVLLLSSCLMEEENESALLIMDVSSEIYSPEVPAEMILEVDQILHTMEYYYFIDVKGFYHFFDQGRPVCPDSTSSSVAMKAEIMNLEGANVDVFFEGTEEEERLSIENGFVSYCRRKKGSGPLPNHCPAGTFDMGIWSYTKGFSCNAGTKNNPKKGIMYCRQDERICQEYYTGDTSKSTQNTPHDCTSCKRIKVDSTKPPKVETPYCW